jgi:hypothetical protein
MKITLILCKTPVCPYGPAPARPCKKDALFTLSLAFPTPRRAETIRRRFETARGQRLRHNAVRGKK